MSSSGVLACWVLALGTAAAGAKEPLPWPPALPGGGTVATGSALELVRAPGTLRPGVAAAAAAPAVDFTYIPGQAYEGNPWSVWGDGLAAGGKYYTSIGDHGAPDRPVAGNAFVYEYDPQTKRWRCLADVRRVLGVAAGHYAPGKIHGRLDLGEDGWLYFSTHRGSARAASDAYHYTGDWVLRCHPGSGKAEVVVRAPVEKHAIPASVLDPRRLIFYGGTAAGPDAPEQRVSFFAYDVQARRRLYAGPHGCYRYFLLAASTGRVYYEKTDDAGTPTGELMRYDQAGTEPPTRVGTCPGLRVATQETADGQVYAVSNGQKGKAVLWAFDVRREQVRVLGPAGVASQEYIASLDADPTGRFLYYVPGAHGGSEADGCPVVRFDVKTGAKTVVAFLHPYLQKAYGYTPIGTFASAVDPRGDKLYVSWHGRRRGSGWDTCALTVLHLR